MMRQVADLKNEVSAILTGIDITEVNDLYVCFQRAAQTMIQKADVPETAGRTPLMLYDGVFDYPSDATMFGSALIDLRPQGLAREPWDTTQKTFIEQFDTTKADMPSGYQVTFEYRQGVQIMRVAQSKTTPRIILDSMSATTGWAAGGNANTLLLDSTVYYQQPGALRFNLAAAGSQGTLTKTLTSALDLTAYQGVGMVFLAVDLPTAAAITSADLLLGSSASNYYAVTGVTQFFTGAFYGQEYALIAFDLSTAVQTGTPVITAMKYLQLRFNYGGTAVTNLRVGGLWISLPSPHEMLFYSAAIFQNGTAAPTVAISSDNDKIILGDASYNLFVRECAREVAFQDGGGMGAGIIMGLDLELDGNGLKPGLYTQFRGDNPSEELRTVGNWYDN